MCVQTEKNSPRLADDHWNSVTDCLQPAKSAPHVFIAAAIASVTAPLQREHYLLPLFVWVLTWHLRAADDDSTAATSSLVQFQSI